MRDLRLLLESGRVVQDEIIVDAVHRRLHVVAAEYGRVVLHGELIVHEAHGQRRLAHRRRAQHCHFSV